MASDISDDVAVYDKIKSYVKTRNGKLLSKNISGVRDRVKVKCYAGHIWEPVASNLLYNSSWCPQCHRGN